MRNYSPGQPYGQGSDQLTRERSSPRQSSGLCRNSIRPSGSPNILRLPALEFSVGAEGLVTFIIGSPNGCFEAGWNYRRRIIQNEAIVVATAAAVE
jgi:hypothetical protein